MAKVKVGQDVIDFIKSQGMSASLKRIGSMTSAERGRDAEYAEGVRRMYGDRRFQNATKSSSSTAPSYGSADAARSSVLREASKPQMSNGAGKAPLKSPAKITVPSGSNFLTNAPIAPKPAAKPKGPATKITPAAKKAAQSAAAWRY